MPLYLQAISLLLPHGEKDVSVENRCRGELQHYRWFRVFLIHEWLTSCSTHE